MNQETIRLLIGGLFVLLLGYQGLRSAEQPNRQRAYLVAAVALAIVLFYSWSLLAGYALGTAGNVLLGLAAVLFGVVVVSVVRAYNAGELRTASRQFKDEMRRYGEERARKTEEK
jgi:uncharacterized membrane protein YccC